MQKESKFNNGVSVICAYKPKEGKEAGLLKIVLEHVPILRGLGLATNRVPHIMQAADGTIVEVFEWVSEKAISDAHSNPEVLKMWKVFEDVCTYIPVGVLAECKHMFSDFEPIN